jgi:hypothetical protein
MPQEKLDKRQVAAVVGIFEDVVEIPNRLMGMNNRNEVELGHERLRGRWSNHHTGVEKNSPPRYGGGEIPNSKFQVQD